MSSFESKHHQQHPIPDSRMQFFDSEKKPGYTHWSEPGKTILVKTKFVGLFIILKIAKQYRNTPCWVETIFSVSAENLLTAVRCHLV